MILTNLFQGSADWQARAATRSTPAAKSRAAKSSAARKLSKMPLQAIDQLSDEEQAPKPSPKAKEVGTPPKPKAKGLKRPAASPSIHKRPAASTEPPPEPSEVVEEGPVLKRPAASSALVDVGEDADPPDAAVAKKPSAKLIKAHKYLYHKLGKWGLKVNGRELLTAGWVEFLFNQQFVEGLFPIISFKLNHLESKCLQVKPHDAIPEEKLEEIAAGVLFAGVRFAPFGTHVVLNVFTC